MNIKRIVIAVLVSVLMVGYITVGACWADCCEDLAKKCCCDEKEGKELDDYGCVCKNGVRIDHWCNYIDVVEV
jgi:hypothetical protein